MMLIKVLKKFKSYMVILEDEEQNHQNFYY